MRHAVRPPTFFLGHEDPRIDLPRVLSRRGLLIITRVRVAVLFVLDPPNKAAVLERKLEQISQLGDGESKVMMRVRTWWQSLEEGLHWWRWWMMRRRGDTGGDEMLY